MVVLYGCLTVLGRGVIGSSVEAIGRNSLMHLI